MKKLILLSCLFLLAAFSYAQSEATYSLTFTSNWTQTAHPHSSGSLPGNAHWSRLVGATHNDGVTFLEMGGIATPGVEDIAETGSNTAFFGEVNAAIGAGNANVLLDGGALSTPAGQISINNVVTTEDYPLLTLLSMIAPSPDWIIAVNSVELLDGSGQWKDQIDIDLYPYDAGTDNGTDYTSGNSNTNPQEPISSLQGVTPFSSEIIGTLSITLNSVLGVNDAEQSTTTLFPNPTSNRVTISNTNILASVRVYNVLGAEILREENINSTSKEIDLGAFPTGIYLVKVADDLSNETVQRLIKR